MVDHTRVYCSSIIATEGKFGGRQQWDHKSLLGTGGEDEQLRGDLGPLGVLGLVLVHVPRVTLVVLGLLKGQLT